MKKDREKSRAKIISQDVAEQIYENNISLLRNVIKAKDTKQMIKMRRSFWKTICTLKEIEYNNA